MFEKLIALLEKLKADDGNKAEISAIEAQIANLKTQDTEIGTLKTEHAAYKQTQDALGDRDLGQMIGFSDAMKEAGLDTAEKVINLKTKADGADKTLEQVNGEKLEMQKIIDAGTTKVDEAVAANKKVLLLTDAKMELSAHVGHAGNFKRAMESIEATGKLERVDGKIRFDGKPIVESVEAWRKEYGDSFLEAPRGAGGGGGGDGNQPQDNTGNTMKNRMEKKFN